MGTKAAAVARLPPVEDAMDALNARVGAVHEEIRQHFPFVARLAVALYDPGTDELKTFLYSPAGTTPLKHYGVHLAQATWLDSLRRERKARVIDDLTKVDLGTQLHGRRIREGAYRSSYTVPVFDGETFLGFIFFNAREAQAFTPRVTGQLDLFVRIISLMVENTLRTAATLVGSVHLLREVSRFRDDETANHLSRMSYYSALIARGIAEEHGRDDEWVEHVRLFAPLHDVGKIGIPDAILLKPGRLADAEFAIMREHPVRGAAILEGLVRDLSLQRVPHVRALLDIARHHHESWDGSGYPDGLAGEAIPLEARIVKIADVFDALSSRRCYKPAWSVDESFSYLQRGRGTQFDPACVDLFLWQRDTVCEVMGRFPAASTSVV